MYTNATQPTTSVTFATDPAIQKTSSKTTITFQSSDLYINDVKVEIYLAPYVVMPVIFLGTSMDSTRLYKSRSTEYCLKINNKLMRIDAYTFFRIFFADFIKNENDFLPNIDMSDAMAIPFFLSLHYNKLMTFALIDMLHSPEFQAFLQELQKDTEYFQEHEQWSFIDEISELASSIHKSYKPFSISNSIKNLNANFSEVLSKNIAEMLNWYQSLGADVQELAEMSIKTYLKEDYKPHYFIKQTQVEKEQQK